MKKWLKLLSINTTAVALGATLTLAFAPYGIFPLAVMSLAGLILLIQGVSAKNAAWLGFLFGLGNFGTGVHWVYVSIHDVGDLPMLLSLLITGSMIAFLSLYPALTCYVTNRYFPTRAHVKTLFAFPALWCLSELFRSWLFSGFPWLMVGYSQTNSPLSGFAPLVSVYGVSVAVLMSSSLLATLINDYRRRDYKATYFCLLGIACIWISGSMLSLISWTSASGKPLKVSLVQGNIAQEMKWVPEHVKLSFDTYTKLTDPLWGKSDLIVWPEAAIPLPLQYARPFIDDMDSIATRSGTGLILGIPIKAAGGPQTGYYNGMASVGAERHVYLKRHLVPFGEYTPFSDTRFASMLKLANIPLPNSVAGDLSQEPFTVSGVKILSSICYEVAFPELMKTDDRDVGLLLTVTNDAWFGRSNAQAQHLQMAAMRAQELRRPALFVSNDGITAIINPNGVVEAAAPTHEAFVLSGTVMPMVGVTPWMRNGTDPFAIIIICMLVASWRAQRKKTLTSDLTPDTHPAIS